MKTTNLYITPSTYLQQLFELGKHNISRFGYGTCTSPYFEMSIRLMTPW